MVLGVTATMCVCLLSVALTSGQTPAQRGAEQKPVLAEQVFKNVQLLKGIPVDEFMETMGFFAASTSMNCTDCHTEESGGDWAKYADDTPLKQTARKMILMVRGIRRQPRRASSMVSCCACQQGTTKLGTIPVVSVQYSDMWEAEPDEIVETSGKASVDQILGKYIQALGGTQRVSALTSLVGKGTYEGFDTDYEKVPVDVLAKTPDQRVTIVHMREGDGTTSFDGHFGWLAAPGRPVPLMELTGGSLEGARLDAELSFPARIQQTLIDWRVGSASIDNKEVQVLQGRLTKGGLPVKLYFDLTSGLLLRLVRYATTLVGVVPTQIDYSDYRDVSGVKMPFHWVVTWTDGRSTVSLSELRANVPVDATKFAKPAPSATKTESH
jgi:hypothetical protein